MRIVIVAFSLLLFAGCGSSSNEAVPYEGEVVTPPALEEGDTESVAPSAPGRVE
jgi:hypothetical protein